LIIEKHAKNELLIDFVWFLLFLS